MAFGLALCPALRAILCSELPKVFCQRFSGWESVERDRSKSKS